MYNLRADYAFESIDRVFSGWAGDSTRTYMVVTENDDGVYVSRIVELHQWTPIEMEVVLEAINGEQGENKFRIVSSWHYLEYMMNRGPIQWF